MTVLTSVFRLLMFNLGLVRIIRDGNDNARSKYLRKLSLVTTMDYTTTHNRVILIP